MRQSIALRYNLVLVSVFLAVAINSAALASPRPSYDYDGNSREDIALWNASSGVFTVINYDGAAVSIQCGLPGDTPLTGNVLTGKRAEVIVWRPTTPAKPSSFFVCRRDRAPLEVKLGMVGDIAFASEDFDGDGRADLTIWRPTTREWIKSLTAFGTSGPGQGKLSTFVFGEQGDIPVPADYDGDGLSQEAVFRPKNGEWYILHASRQAMTIKQWGLASDIPVPADYDGDGLTDIAVWRPESGSWYVIPSSSPKKPWIVALGLPGDIALPREMNGDSKVDFVVFRPSTGQIFYRTSRTSKTFSLVVNAQFALGTNVYRPARPINDFDGDGRSEFGIVRAISGGLNWLLALSSGGEATNVQWGLPGDLIVPSDYTGDGRTDYAVLRNDQGSLNWWVRPSDGSLPYSLSFGFGGDTVFSSNCDQDKKADLTVVRAGSGASGAELSWYARSSLTGATIVTTWGRGGDQVASGDFDGDGLSDPTVVRTIGGLLFWFTKTLSGLQLPGLQWGLPGDKILPADYDGDGRTDYAVLRNIRGLLYLFVRTSAGLEYSPIQWGYTGDVFAAGNYRGGLKLQPAVWRAGGSAEFLINNFPGLSYAVAFGQKGDTALGLLLPQLTPGSAPQVVPTPTGDTKTGTAIVCDISLRNSDGPGGFVHKPISDSDGKLAIVLNQRFGNNTTKLELFEGNKLLETPRYVGAQNGGRPHFRARKPGASYPTNLVERWTTSEGKKYCITIPNPSLRYD